MKKSRLIDEDISNTIKIHKNDIKFFLYIYFYKVMRSKHMCDSTQLTIFFLYLQDRYFKSD